MSPVRRSRASSVMRATVANSSAIVPPSRAVASSASDSAPVPCAALCISAGTSRACARQCSRHSSSTTSRGIGLPRDSRASVARTRRAAASSRSV